MIFKHLKLKIFSTFNIMSMSTAVNIRTNVKTTCKNILSSLLNYFRLDLYRIRTGFPVQYFSSTSEMAARQKDFDFMIVGLGNHHMQGTRHSIGMTALDILASQLSAEWEHGARQYGGYISYITLQSEVEKSIKLLLFKPKAFMNVNGQGVDKTAKIFGIPPRNIYLVHDELDKSPGKFQLKEWGTSGGHNGVNSCIQCLRSNAMPRLKLGIGRPTHIALVPMYVLDTVPEEELSLIQQAIHQGIQVMLSRMRNRLDTGETTLSLNKKEIKKGSGDIDIPKKGKPGNLNNISQDMQGKEKMANLLDSGDQSAHTKKRKNLQESLPDR